MLLNNILKEMDIPFVCNYDAEFDSLGLVSYCNNDRDCTFINSEK